MKVGVGGEMDLHQYSGFKSRFGHDQQSTLYAPIAAHGKVCSKGAAAAGAAARTSV